MDDNKLYDEVTRAARAERLLNDTLFTECVEKVRQAYIARWQITPPNAEREREQLWLSLKALEQVMNEIAQVANSGKMAKITLERAYARKELQAN
jgi:hypothetical protein